MKNWNSMHWTLAGAGLSLVFAFFIYRAVRADPQVEEFRQKRDEIMTRVNETSDPEEQRRLWQELRESMQNLSASQRTVLREDGRKKRDEEEVRYFTLSDDEKTRWLDARIDRMEEMKARWESQGDKKGAAPGGGNPGGFGPPRDGKGGWSKLSSEEKENRRKQFLDNTTPEQRARRDQIAKDMRARREARGLPPGGFGR